jgi:IclR family KDG regulon transcriptional repressor
MGLTAIAAPLRNVHGDVIASLSVSGPTFRFDEDRVNAAIDQVTDVAAEVSERLGWRVPKRSSAEIDS